MSEPFPSTRFLRLRAGEDLLLEKVRVARGFWIRGIGLMFRKQVPADYGQGLLFPGCRELHTCSMRFALDVFFLDAEGQLIQEQRNVTPWRIVRGPQGTRHALETAAGTLPSGPFPETLVWEACLDSTTEER